MSKRLLSRVLGMFQSRTQVGVDKAGNRYFTRVEEVDGGMKEKRWVEFKGADQDPTTVPGDLFSCSFSRHVWIMNLISEFMYLGLSSKCRESHSLMVLVVEWICWLNGQRKKVPTPEELAELEARRERVKQNIELLKKKEEEERKPGVRPVKKIGKADSPNLQSFVKQQYTGTSPDQKTGPDEVSRPKDAADTEDATTDTERSSEPTGTGATFKPGTWQPPT
ncbi:hypothetical protein PR202_ga15375 [Eleusine coracana subsp. coracana]|uniref:NADH dehydrogenase [ubiquinone] 1 alpha subcomplex subunit 12 n=1 Tax=Eleusine coracana subsp. coracana TaxID=191504 RepID=A0AAV5CK06_ELECO|nr:hypothetical protein PR202_ga15375 [Eleusine coracana subsp. coracana]